MLETKKENYILVSACLAGVKCRYDGRANTDKEVIKLVKQGKAILVCPEQLGGLPTPRPAAEIIKGRVKDKDGSDYTAQFKKGAQKALKIAKIVNCEKAYLKANSPSCGFGKIYDGSFSGKLIKGNGVFAGLLKKNKIKIISR